MTQRYLWTLERSGHSVRGGLETVAELTAILTGENLPDVMPADWIVAFLQADADRDGAAFHESPLGWHLRIQRAV